MELKAKLVSAPLLMYWIALNTCTNPEESGKKDGRERETEREKEREREREKEIKREREKRQMS